MAQPRRIKVMISSRCNDPIEYRGAPATLSDVRADIQMELEAETLFGSALFDVWINEVAPAAEGTVDSWDECMGHVRAADIILVLYNGNAGWAKQSGDIGICHAELETAMAEAPAKVRLIELTPLLEVRAGGDGERDKRFRAYAAAQSLFRGAVAANGEELLARCKQDLREAVAAMVLLGRREARRGRYDTGTALDWTRLDYARRKQAMEETMRSDLGSRSDVTLDGDDLYLRVDGREVMVLCHAIPAAMSIASAREMVGQPFLRDYERAAALAGGRAGPVHLIACHRGVTEAQAIRQLGFPDATIVTTGFGVYVACDIQKIQMVFVADCRDDTMTRAGLQRFFEWLAQSGEDRRLSARAASRGRIVSAIAAEHV